jgi:putative ABC transport system permease protein
MIKYFFLSIYRNILKNKISNLLNLTNLVFGFGTFILFASLVSYEFNYDTFNANYDNIYRVQTKQEDSYPTNFCTYSPSALRYHLLSDLPEVEKVLLMREISGNQGSGQFFTLPDGGQLYEKLGYWCENTIFDIFSLRIKEGTSANALTEPNTIVISETLQHKLFPKGGAIGKQVVIGKRYPLTVTAVIEDFPVNSSIKPSYLISMSTFETLSGSKGFRDNWTAIDNDNYILLKKGADPSLVDAKIKDTFKDVKEFEKATPYLHPLSKQHLSPNSQSDYYIILSMLSLAAILMLILSCINYVNLSIANSTQRACEIGIKKVVGFSKKGIAVQFLGETMLFTLVSMILGIVAAVLAFPVLNNILDKHMDSSVFFQGHLILIVILTSLVAGILSGIYPALIISSYNPVRVLKGKLFNDRGKTISTKKLLITAQFAISLFMLIVSLIMNNHVQFILNKNLGFDNKNILFAEMNVKEKVSFETIKNRLIQHPEIADVSMSSTMPYNGNIGGYVTWEGAMPDQKEMISRNYVNSDFIPTYNLKMVYGRNFSPEYPADNKKCIINETALKAFGWSDPIGKQLILYGKAYPVVGVVKDFHAFSVHNPIPNYIMFLNDNVLVGSKMLTIRYNPGNGQKAKQLVTRELELIMPNEPFELKDFNVLLYTENAFQLWKAFEKLFLIFAIVSLIVSSVGLFGLMLFTIKRRIKEIGIRKVMGSSVTTIYSQLSLEIFALLGSATIIACPAAFFIYKTMPGSYKEPLSIMVFIIGIVVIAVLAQLTISYHVLKVAVSNPVEALRNE